MDNQHRKIKGYRELTQVEIDLMNQIKQRGVELGELTTALRAYHLHQAAGAVGDEAARLASAQPERWWALGRTKLQEGLMALTRSVAQPGFF